MPDSSSKTNGPKVVIVTAPSGGGKSTIIRHLLERFDNLEFSISACTRKMRKGEQDGKDYYFHSVEDFQNKIELDLFLEWEEVYENQFYGTLKSEVERLWGLKRVVLFDLDVRGASRLNKHFGDDALSLFIKPPSLEELRSRLLKRGTEDEASMEKRMRRAEFELTFENDFDQVVINDDLETAVGQAIELVDDYIK